MTKLYELDAEKHFLRPIHMVKMRNLDTAFVRKYSADGPRVFGGVWLSWPFVPAFLPFMIVDTLSYGPTMASIQCWKHLETVLNQIAPSINAVLMTKP